MLKKNDEILLTIEDMGVDGAGIGRLDGMTFFVKDALIGDQISAVVMKLKKSYGYARLKEVLQPSPFRVKPRCPIHKRCGGCQIQALSYEKQLEYKVNKVKNNLIRLGGFSQEQFMQEEIKMEPVIGMQDCYHYRNKAQFPVGRDKEGKLIAGFYAAHTHSIIPVDNCLLGVPQNQEVMQRVLKWMESAKIEPYDERTGTGLIRHVLIRFGFTSKQLMVCLVINGSNIPDEAQLIRSLAKLPEMTSISININTQRNNVIMGDKVRTIWGTEYIEDKIGGIRFQISPLSFYQVNPVQTEKLYGKVLEYAGLTGGETVWDLYCGIGTISLFLAQKAKQVYGVEIVPQAVEDAKRNAILNGIENVAFFTGKAEELLPEFYEGKKGIHPDVMVVDPPRKGCDRRLLETMVKMQPERIVYVSCDPATLARDLKFLCGEGYGLRKVQVVDQFCHTVHVETVCLLSNRKPDARVKIDVDLEDYYRIKDEQKKNKASE